ncbi:MAG: sugar nucleotide-binding protein [Planctomycetales bacterium]|nr:sugar nucleotide-binding protein [Planctomycetales bacterium]
MQCIPTRIVGSKIIRHTATRRSDGSTILIRQSSAERPGLVLPHEETVTAAFGFTSEASFTAGPLRRTLRCVAGELFVCIVDVRPDSTTRGHWQGLYLREGDGRTLSVPRGVACGWQVLSSLATLEHRTSRATCEVPWQRLRWNDRQWAIGWPHRPTQLADHRSRSRRQGMPAAERRPAKVNSSRPSTQPASGPPEASPLDASRQRSRRLESGRPQTPALRPAAGRSTRARRLAGSPTAPTESPLVRPPRPARPPQPLVLVVGSSGQLGRDLCRELRTLGTVVGACRSPDRGSLLPVPAFIDISRPASLRQAIRQVRPTLIVNAAGLTDIDRAETDPRLAQLVNATAPAIMAEEAQRIGAGLVHYCSDMVFDGSGEKPWRETDTPHAQNQYARTKLIGTQAIQDSGVPHLILRAGWLYSTHGDNYIRRLIDSLTYRNSVTLPADHYGSPTSTAWLAQLTAQLLSKASGRFGPWLTEQGGLYHAAALGYASKMDVGEQVLATCRQHGLPIVLQKLQPKPVAEFPGAARMPPNCRLDASRLALTFGVELPRWQRELNEQIAIMLDCTSHPALSVA